MAWAIEFEDGARKDLSKLDKQVARRIIAFLRDRVALLDDPRSIGHALQGNAFASLWTYRTGDYRVICQIEDNAIKILVVRIGNRREVYR